VRERVVFLRRERLALLLAVEAQLPRDDAGIMLEQEPEAK
jgi:hypothetical protein